MQLTLAQVAELFSVPESTITQWVRQRNLPVHESNLQYRFDRGELLAWAAAHDRGFSLDALRRFNAASTGEMILAAALERGGVASQVAGNDRYEVFREAIHGLPIPSSLDWEALLDALLTRERSGGTAIGHGIAIPHARYPLVLHGIRSLVRVCYLKHPLDYHAADGQPVETLFLMICPTVEEHLQLLARLAWMLRSADFRSLLASRPDAARLVAAVRVAEGGFPEASKLPAR